MYAVVAAQRCQCKSQKQSATSRQRIQSGLFLVWSLVTRDKSWAQISNNYMGGGGSGGNNQHECFWPRSRILGHCHISYNQDFFYGVRYFSPSIMLLKRMPMAHYLLDSLCSIIIYWIHSFILGMKKYTTFFMQAIKIYFGSSYHCALSWK